MENSLKAPMVLFSLKMGGEGNTLVEYKKENLG
jgi:hypothetical protein